MSLKFRRLLYISFILLFFIITPLISLYAAGYKFGSGFKIQKTGMLIINSEPPNASIYVNGKIQKNFLKTIYLPKQSLIKTPAKIKNILPGEYLISVEKDQYWPWQKKLQIHPGQSTFAEDIVLFKKNIPLQIISGQHKKFSLSPNEKKIAVKSNDEITLFNLEDNSGIAVKIEKSSSSNNIIWSNDSESIIIGKRYYSASKPTNGLALSLSDKISQIKWDKKNNNLIYFYLDSKIYEYDLANDISQEHISAVNIIDYLIKDGYLYYINLENEKSFINVWSMNEKKLVRKINLPEASYAFINPDHKLLNIYNSDHNIIYLIDPFSQIKTLKDAVENIKIASWVNEDKMIFSNDFEIWIYDLNSGEKTLLTRISNEIKNIFWHPSNNYIIYATDGQINIIELDKREKYNIIKIAEYPKIDNVILNKKGNILYFYSEIGQQKGIYKLNIQ